MTMLSPRLTRYACLLVVSACCSLLSASSAQAQHKKRHAPDQNQRGRHSQGWLLFAVVCAPLMQGVRLKQFASITCEAVNDHA